MTNDEDVAHASGKDTVKSILNVDDFETAMMLFTVRDDSDTTYG